MFYVQCSGSTTNHPIYRAASGVHPIAIITLAITQINPGSTMNNLKYIRAAHGVHPIATTSYNTG